MREGSDLTIIFHVANKDLFLAAVDQHLKEARANFAGKLKEDKQQYQQITIESYVTPLREVSLHRAMFDDYVVYSNSPVGIRRVIDTYKGKLPALADSLDYQYMRTVFRLEDPLEDGFVFLSDPFIRNLVGPATRIKERRRLEALTSLSMVTNGALFTAWETGKLPANHAELLAYTGLKAEQLFSPDGDAAFWNGEQKMAVSSFYNTQNFATPLIEIPISGVTPSEQREYEDFRLRYLGLWRQFFDPIGIRIGLNKKEVRWETYILPLVKTTEYNNLRRLAGDGTMKLDPGMFSDKTIFQFMSHLSPTARERQEYGRVLSGFSRDIPGLNWLGNWFTFRLDDSPAYGKLLERTILRDMGLIGNRDYDEEIRLFFEHAADGRRRDPQSAGVCRRAGRRQEGDRRRPAGGHRVGADQGAVQGDDHRADQGHAAGRAEQHRRNAAAAHAVRSTMPWWTAPGICRSSRSASRTRSTARSPASRPRRSRPLIDVNTSLYASPKAAVHTKEFLHFYFEWETHRRALANTNLLYPLYRGGVISRGRRRRHHPGRGPQVSSASSRSAPIILRTCYERKTDEVDQQTPRQHPPAAFCTRRIEPGSPLASVLEQFPSLRADLRFREDGLHTW